MFPEKRSSNMICKSHLDLLSIASYFHFHPFIIFSSGLTLHCQSNSFVFTYLDLPSSASLVCALALSQLFTWLDLHLWCQDLLIFFESPWFWLSYLLSSEGLSEAFIECETLLHSASLFQMSNQIFDAMRHPMYDCATNEMSEHFFFEFFFSFFILMNAKCKCHMQMPWLVLPMRYALICYW